MEDFYTRPLCLLATSGVVLVGPEMVNVAEDFTWPGPLQYYSY
jgi:hypothetical protein